MGCSKAVPVSAPVTCAESSSDTVIRGSLFSERLASLDPGFRGPRETAVGFNLGIWLREHKPESEVSLWPGVGVRGGAVHQTTKWRAAVWSELASLLISSRTGPGLRFVASCPTPTPRRTPAVPPSSWWSTVIISGTDFHVIDEPTPRLLMYRMVPKAGKWGSIQPAQEDTKG